MFFPKFQNCRLVEYLNPWTFHHHISNFLNRRPDENAYIIDELMRRRGAQAISDGTRMFAVVDDRSSQSGRKAKGDDILAAIMVLRGTFCVITGMNNEMIAPLVRELSGARSSSSTIPALVCVLAPAMVAEEFARLWSAQTGQIVRRTSVNNIYLLRTGPDHSDVPGELVKAQDDDRPFLESWLAAFREEAWREAEMADLAALFDLHVKRGHVYLWKAPSPIAMGALTFQVDDYVWMNFLYIPAERRRQGFGKAMCAALLRQAKTTNISRCFATTETSNVAANQMYRALGAHLCTTMVAKYFDPLPSIPTNHGAGRLNISVGRSRLNLFGDREGDAR